MTKTLTGHQRHFNKNEFIVSKTDTRGIITYANPLFISIAGYSEKELIGKPHNILRHPDMPKCIFKMWWEYMNAGQEAFAYVVNRCKNGDHYWVHAHGTASLNEQGKIIGLHSNRRVPNEKTLKSVIIPLYKKLRTIEASESNKNTGMEKAYAHLRKLISEKHGEDYNAWLFSL
jgi:PAS domain S-box-containing protein